MNAPSTIRVEVVAPPERRGELAGKQLVERFGERVRELGASLGDIANDLREQLDSRLADRPESGWRLEQVELAFSLDLEAEAGVVIARAGTTAGFQASLRWSQTPNGAPGDR